MSARHIVNLSGGKDSQACALLAAERGMPFRLVMADTGNENKLTIEHAHYLAEFVGVPLEMVRYDFTEKMARKRDFIAREWAKADVPHARIERALEIIQPTGIPFLDLCLWKGRFPSARAQFCTEFLKAQAIEDHVVDPALKIGPVIQWIGVRRDESPNRRNAQMFQRVRRDGPHDMLLFRPLIHWTAQNVISYATAVGAKHNPLYSLGMGRVGCFPCVNVNKAEIGQIAIRFPETEDKLREWEVLVAGASKLGAATFFAADMTPEGADLVRTLNRMVEHTIRSKHRDLLEDGREVELRRMERKIRRDLSASIEWPKADAAFAWSKTDHGGRQLNMLRHAFEADEGLSCSSQYGLCE